MTKKIIKYYIILLVIFFSWVNLAHAGLEITEIMYAPDTADAGHEWIEIHNNGGSQDISGWSVMDYDTKWHSHEIVPDSSVNLNSGAYAIIGQISSTKFSEFISNFKSKWPSENILFFRASFDLGNDSGRLGLSSDGVTVVNDVSYSSSLGAKDDGNSLQLIGGILKPATPTPGTANSSNNDSTDNSLDNNIDIPVDETIDPIPLVKDNPAILKIIIKITSPKIVTAGIPFSLSSLTTTNRGETYAIGKFVWNFGDGMVREIGEANPFEYTYQYPGDYALTLSYYDSTFSTVPDATDRMTIKVVPVGINISSVGNTSDPFVEIENKSSYEIILSNWVVTAGIHYFIIPEGTTLLPSKKIKLSPKITGFVGEDLNSIVISNGSKETIANYPIQIIKPIQNKILSVSKTTSYINPVSIDNSLPDDSLPQNSQVINLNDLGASAENTGINISNSTYPIVGLLVVIGLGVASFLLIKKKRDVDDYMEQGISAKDMTIIE